VLGAVDTVFARAEAFAGLSADPVAPVHEALPDKAPGLVEIWPLEKTDDFEKKEGWAAPFDVQTVTSGVAKLARRIAKTVALWRRQGRRPKDVLILMRRRGALFEAVIRALKNEQVPVAGADRLILTQHIAVTDLMVLADAILLPDDDLALATVLKSPLFGLDEEALFALAWNRKSSLSHALRAQQPELAARFDEMREKARERSPFAFYAWLLGARRGRQRILARLGHEAADALDEFLNLALDYERTEPPSLQGFLAWLRAAEAEVKRDMEMERDEVRVITVHGAKGLEAPIVILADTTTPPQGWHPPRLLHMPLQAGADAMVWATAKANDVGPMPGAREAALDAARDEYRRLLYVAMTRAAERLIVCGVEGRNKIPDGCWYRLVSEALMPASSTETADDGAGEVLRFRKGAVEAEQLALFGGDDTAEPEIVLPDWLTRAVPREPTRWRAVAPSGDEADAATGGGRADALLRGSLVHRLLQALPEIPAERRRQAAEDYLARAAARLPAAETARLADRVTLILEHPRFAALYAPGSRAEVPIVGRVTIDGETVPISGQIDRLAATPDAVLIADFKTNRNPPRRVEDVPPATIRQLALYRAVLAKLYPHKPLRAALIWTEVPEVMELSADVLDTALAQVTAA